MARWRTAATVMALGVALASAADDVSWGSAGAGAVLVLVGTAGIVHGTRRYRQVTRKLESGTSVTGTKGRGALAASTVLIVGLILSLLLILLGRT